MASAIQETLSRAFKSGGTDIKISDALKFGFQDAGMYQSLEQYASYINKASHSLLGIKNYLGVNMTSYDNTLHVWDGTKSGQAHVIEFFDLIGQPTWLALQLIQVKCIMRGDIHCPDRVTIPDGILATLSPGAIIPYTESQQRTNITLPGSGIVIKVLHIGDFRNPDGVGWSTTFDIAWDSSWTGVNEQTQQVQDSSQQQNPNNSPPSDQPPPVTSMPVQE